MVHFVDLVLKSLLETDSFAKAAVVLGHQRDLLSPPFLSFAVLPSCWLQCSSVCRETLQIINQAEDNSLFFVARLTVHREGK